jgi:hypothetical protein
MCGGQMDKVIPEAQPADKKKNAKLKDILEMVFAPWHRYSGIC